MFVRQQDARFCLAVPSCLPVPPPALRECSRPNAEQRTQRARFACSAPPPTTVQSLTPTTRASHQ